MTVGARNIYGCDKCLKCIVTVDKADGTTPFMIGCEATKGCTGEMYSSFYKGSLDDEPTHEWYKPEGVERATLSPDELDHVERGGLLLRKIKS